MAFEHYLITRYSVYQPEWNVSPSKEWLEQRWELFQDTVESVLKQTVPYHWLLLCDVGTPSHWTDRLSDIAEVVPTGDNWLKSLQRSLPSGRKITTRLDSDDIIAPNHLAEIEKVVSNVGSHFVCCPNGYQSDGANYYEYAEKNGPFLSLIEDGTNTVYTTAHGRALNKHIVLESTRRTWIQVVHGGNLRNKIKGTRCQRPEWS